MNTSSLKTFAQNARNKLRAQVAARLNYWLGAEGGTAPDTAAHRQFAPQIKELAEALKKEGRDGLVERISYTWFNRLAALRFMDANDFHPFGVRVVTPAGENEILPALLQQARAGALNPEIRAKLANPQAFDDILAGRIPVAHPETELFGMLLLAACNYYHAAMPFLFEKLGDATQLLLPEDLLSEQSILTDIRENLTDEDCTEVELIGWLYQFYISEKKDNVMGRKKAVPTEDIPAVTQLFTPHWIVRYLVENSLGRLWLLNRPHSRLREQMLYYIEGEPETDFLKIEKTEDIKLVDPACGSGHMLTYAFDLLYLIYEEEGYDAPEIPSLILKHNLHGLEICDRAAALAAFALCMKARAKDRRFFKRLTEGGDQAPRPHIIELQDVRFAENELHDYIRALGLSNIFQQPTLRLLHQFEEAKNFGSLIQPCFEEPAVAELRRILAEKDLGDQLFLHETHAKILRMLEQAEALTQRYQVVVANPPYMGGKQLNDALRAHAKLRFPDSKSDIFAMFIERGFDLVKPLGFSAMVTMQSWMFLSSYEELRQKLLRAHSLQSLLHMGNMVMGIAFGTAAAVWRNGNFSAPKGHYCYVGWGDLANGIEPDSFPPPNSRNRQFPEPAGRYYEVASTEFRKIPGCPIAYWVSPRVLAAFGFGSLGSQIETEGQNKTADNDRYLRFVWEISKKSLGRPRKWILYAKGGTFRKWYGNLDTVVDWSPEARAHYRKSSSCRIVDERFWYKEGVSWTDVTSGSTAFRFLPEGATFDMAGPTAFFPDSQQTLVALALLNTRFVCDLLAVFNPTLHVQLRDVRAVPLPQVIPIAAVASLAESAVSIARADWDNFETSSDFCQQPLLRPGLKGATLEASWQNWDVKSTAAIRQMQEIETENNRLFIAAYSLDGELQPEVPEAQITLACADARRDMTAFISHSIGCMMGRYSLDRPGLILADAAATVEDFIAKVPIATYAPDEDGILPVLDGEWFSDDIVGRFREFLRVTFGDESFAANLRFIEESLGKPEAKTGKIKPTEIRSYFVSEFYKNHLSTERAYGYKKRPIYWMVSSPNGSFQALIYLHRYTRDTLNRVLDGYVRPFLDKLEQRQQACTVISNDAAAKPAARTAAAKELLKLGKMLKEIREWERDTLLPLAQKRIELDLDDGVKVNYLKFKGVLVPIPGLEKKEED
jgi:hypothetical protein